MQNTPSRQHTHHFDDGNPLAQKRILMATILTAVMMLLEVIGGWIFQSMALLADGWHMSSHMLALGLHGIMPMISALVSAHGKLKFLQATAALFC